MKRIIFIPFLFALVSFTACNQIKKENKEADNTSQDSIKTEKAGKTDTKEPQQKKQTVKYSAEELAPYFTEQISGAQTLIQPNGIKHNTSGIYCYFRLKDKRATTLRFHIQYWAEKYSNVDSYTFDADGKTFNYIANRNESGSGDSRIAQSSSFYWYDNNVNKTDLTFLNAIANGKDVTVSLIDRATNIAVDVLTLSDEEKLNIRRTIDYYYALDGALIPRKGMVNIRQ